MVQICVTRAFPKSYDTQRKLPVFFGYFRRAQGSFITKPSGYSDRHLQYREHREPGRFHVKASRSTPFFNQVSETSGVFVLLRVRDGSRWGLKTLSLTVHYQSFTAMLSMPEYVYFCRTPQAVGHVTNTGSGSLEVR